MSAKTKRLPSVRVGEDLYDAVMEVADSEDVKASELIRDLLTDILLDGEAEKVSVPIVGVTPENTVVPFPGVCRRCFNFGKITHLFVSEDGEIVHNSKPCPECSTVEKGVA